MQGVHGLQCCFKHSVDGYTQREKLLAVDTAVRLLPGRHCSAVYRCDPPLSAVKGICPTPPTHKKSTLSKLPGRHLLLCWAVAPLWLPLVAVLLTIIVDVDVAHTVTHPIAQLGPGQHNSQPPKPLSRSSRTMPHRTARGGAAKAAVKGQLEDACQAAVGISHVPIS